MRSDRTTNQKDSEAHWEAVWQRLKAEGRVEVVNPESVRPPHLPSYTNILDRLSRGEDSGIRQFKRKGAKPSK